MRGSKICIGIVAHVDAGKTTLSEALLYHAGALRKLGRVDHKDAFLDNFSLERERGITIFSKQANFSWRGREMILLDTPGHVDFSAEMERTLQVLDYCILVISGADGIQGHTGTLWKLLKKYEIPTFLFVNKMDQPAADKGKLLAELQEKFGGGCIEFGGCYTDSADGIDGGAKPAGGHAGGGRDCGEFGHGPAEIAARGGQDRKETGSEEDRERFFDELAMCSEALLEEYLEAGKLSEESIAAAVARRQVFPCYFGSALRLEGVEELLDGLRRFAPEKEYPEEFGARVYKISRDGSGNRLTHLKVTGGALRVKTPVSNAFSAASSEEIWEEKADALRIYGGAGFRTTDCVEAGGVCAVTGLSRTFVGQGLGYEKENEQPVLAPVLTYRLILPTGADAVKVLAQLRTLEEEEPELNVVWKEAAKEIHVQVMGEVQTEILKSLLRERFGLEAEFGDGRIVYKETIATAAEGIGHFEPLRHYAEVHLLLEPGEPGSGITIGSVCSEDKLDRNWQRLIFTHIEEKVHLGVLTGSPVTDVKITLLTGRSHLKHTEGGDFRQATYRALRQGLMQCENVLLEPVFAFTMELPTECLGRAMSDVKRLFGDFEPPETAGEMSVLTGSAPVSTFGDYQRELNAYTKGMGRLSCTLRGYEPCHNAEEVIGRIGYDPESDLENPASSVFCAHGAGFVVEWDKVPEYAHVESGWNPEEWAEKSAGAGGARENREGLSGNRAERSGVREGALEGRTEENGGEEGRPGISASERRGVSGRLGESGKLGGTGKERGASQTGGGRSDYITKEEIDAIFRRTYGKSEQDYAPYRVHQKNTGSHMTGTVRDGKPVSGGETGKEESARDGRRMSEGELGEGTTGDGKIASGGIGAESRGAGKTSGHKGADNRSALESYFLVDGYNIIFAWENLRELAELNIDSARDKLMDICCNFQGCNGATMILVFDAYKVKGNPGSVQKYHNIYVVYTKEAETADQYIEKTVHKIGKKHRVTVATSDALEQMIIWGEGAVRLSARGFAEEVAAAEQRMREEYSKESSVGNRINQQNP